MKALLGGAALVGSVAIFGANIPSVSPITNPPIRQSGLEAHDESATGSLLGQFRTNISAWLWVHTDLYLHNGVMMRPITDQELKSGVTIERSKADGNEDLHREVFVTAVPSADRDFRGVFGDVDRQVNAWKDMHNHTHNDPAQTLPLFRLMTWLDPQFIEGWTNGAMIFARERNDEGTKKALSFLREGLQDNPESVDILTNIAYLEITRNKDLNAAIPLLEQARGLGLAHRDTMADNEKDALEDTYRWLALCYRDTGRPDKMNAVIAEGLSVFPDESVLQIIQHRATGDAASAAEALRKED